MGLLDAEAAGTRLVYRVGPSFVAARVGMEAREPVRPSPSARQRHGLVVVGSHVELTGRQLARLLELPGVETMTIDVPELLNPKGRVASVGAAIEHVLSSLAESDVVLMTSRQRVVGSSAEDSPRHRSPRLRRRRPDRGAGTDSRGARLGHRQGRNHLA